MSGGLPRRLVWQLLGVAGAALLLRLLFVSAVLQTHPFADVLRFNGDTGEYHLLAAGLAEGRGYGRGGVNANVVGLVRVPLYPLLLAGFLKVAPTGKAAVIGLFVAQAAGDAVLAWLAGLLAWRLWRRPWAALVAAGLMALNATGIGLTATILTDGPFALLLCGATLLLLRAVGSRGVRPAALCGLLLAAATLTKPTPLLLPLLLPAAWWLAGRAGGGGRKLWISLRNLAVCLCLFVLPVAAWAVRNKVEHGVPAVSTVTDRNLRFMIGPEVEVRAAAGGKATPALVSQRYYQLAHEDDRWLNQPDMTAAEFVRLQREYVGLLVTHFPGLVSKQYVKDIEPNLVGHWDILFRQLPVAGTPAVTREGFAPATGYAAVMRLLLRPLFALDEIKLLRWAFVALAPLVPAMTWVARRRRAATATAVLLVVAYLVLTAATTHSQGSRILYPAHALVVALAAGLPSVIRSAGSAARRAGRRGRRPPESTPPPP